MKDILANEMMDLKRWMDSAFGTQGSYPFSFRLGGRSSQNFLSEWRSAIQDHGRGENLLSLKDPRSGLELRCTYHVFEDFPAVEWVLEIRNGGSTDTPIIERLRPLDFSFPAEDDRITLHWALGSSASRTDFAPKRDELAPGKTLRLAPVGGRSSNTTAFPFFNIEFEGHGLIIGIGWSGQWEALLSREEEGSLRLESGMEGVHLRLHPGESIRSPRILLLFWRGDDRIRGHNLLRRFILAHRSPKRDGRPILGPLACNGGFQMFDEANRATEDNQIALARRFREFGLETEYWWIDAGWFEGRWPNGVGNWIIRKDGFPRGLGPVSEALKELGMGLILWFEPERVYEGTWLDREHPDWLLSLPGNPNRLLDLGNPEARRWLTEHISSMIEREGISIYRQDFNMDPLPFWRASDEPDRRGMREIRHIEGLYAFWDELLKRHPGLIIDNCASGGRRIDLETTWRSIPLWRTDYQYFEPNGYQCHTYGISLYLPSSGTGCGGQDAYSFRSSINSAVILGWDLYDPDFPKEEARRRLAEYRKIRPYFHGDFYPLTAHGTGDDIWMSYQFHREDLEEGMLLVFRRHESPYLTARLRLHALKPEARYELTFEDSGKRQAVAGRDLLGGIDLTIKDAPGSLLITYRQLKGPREAVSK